MEGDYNATGPCVCGFGDEFFTLESGRPVCTVCGGIIGKNLPEFFEPKDVAEKKTILIIDDQDFFRQKICGILEGKGYEVLSSSDGIGGVKTIADVYTKGKSELTSKIDAVVLDLIMPGDLDGFQTLAVIKVIVPDMPVVVLTSSPPKKELLQKLARLGAKKYINKSAASLDSLILKNIQDL